MKIIVINWQDIKNPFGGGAESHFQQIFKRIAANGHDITLLCCKFEGAPDEEIIDGIKIMRRGSRNLFNFIVPFELKKLDKLNGYDIVIDDVNKIPFYTPLYVKKPLLGISHHFFGKSIYRETNFISASYVYFSEKLLDTVYKNTPFAVVSESTREEFLSRGFKPEQLTIVQNAINHEQFPMAIVEKEPFPVVTYFGRLKKYKSVDHLFHAFAKVKQEVGNAKLYIIGKGDFRPELDKLAEQLEIKDSTVFFGFVSEEDKVKILSRSHIVVNTSMKEGWGITNIESNACGTPTVSANVPGLRDSVKDGVSGLLYEYGNIEDLSDKLLKLLQDNALLKYISKGAVEWSKQFSWDDSAKIMEELCRKTLRS